MSSITVRFEGICTHITYPYAPSDSAHRVVMPKAWGTFQDHIARLYIPTSAASFEAIQAFAMPPQLLYEGLVEDYYCFLLRGVELKIDNAKGTYVQQRTFLCGIPRLSEIAERWLGAPDDIVTRRDPEQVWAYFNAPVGTWSATLVHDPGAAAAVLESETTDDKPVLRATVFASEEPPQSTLTLERGKTVILQNVGDDDDADDDFGIHFRVVRPARRPAVSLGPSGVSECLKSRQSALPQGPSVSIGPGCSNSLFP